MSKATENPTKRHHRRGLTNTCVQCVHIIGRTREHLYSLITLTLYALKLYHPSVLCVVGDSSVGLYSPKQAVRLSVYLQ